MYFLVLLAASSAAPATPPEHEPFVDSLIDRRLVLLGGELGAGGHAAAYVLRCDSLDVARAVVATDPLVASGTVTASVAPWDLVGIDPDLVDPALVVTRPVPEEDGRTPA
ncbi:hypothetical protein ACI78T_11110 [Blastococcus sp. SYSU D00922]